MLAEIMYIYREGVREVREDMEMRTCGVWMDGSIVGLRGLGAFTCMRKKTLRWQSKTCRICPLACPTGKWPIINFYLLRDILFPFIWIYMPLDRGIQSFFLLFWMQITCISWNLCICSGLVIFIVWIIQYSWVLLVNYLLHRHKLIFCIFVSRNFAIYFLIWMIKKCGSTFCILHAKTILNFYGGGNKLLSFI